MSKTFRKYPITLTDSWLHSRMRKNDISGAYIEFNAANERPYCWVANVKGKAKRGAPKKTLADAHHDLEGFVKNL